MPPEFHFLSNKYKVPRRPFLQISKFLLPLLHLPPYILAPAQPPFQILVLEIKIPPSSYIFKRQNSNLWRTPPTFCILAAWTSLFLSDSIQATAPHAYLRLQIPSVKMLRGHSGPNLLLGCSSFSPHPTPRCQDLIRAPPPHAYSPLEPS